MSCSIPQDTQSCACNPEQPSPFKIMIAAGKKKIVLNVANIKYIDSTGLGTLVAANISAKTQGASVRLCHLGQKFHEIMQMTKLLTVFDVYDTQAAAVSSFQAAKATAG